MTTTTASTLTPEAPTVAPLSIVRLPEQFVSDDKRVITRYLNFGDETRIKSILQRLMALGEPEVVQLLATVQEHFSDRHYDLDGAFESHFNEVAGRLDGQPVSPARRALIGAYFTLEYSIESAALFNPSIVLHPDQTGLPEGAIRFLMSMRATGEGHVSSIVYRRGVIDKDCQISFDPAQRYAYTAKPIPDKLYNKALFLRKLQEMAGHEPSALLVLERVGDQFTLKELEGAINEAGAAPDLPASFEIDVKSMQWLARANYELRFPAHCLPAETVIFPATENESRGMEDLRLVRFIDDRGQACYYGTYTAYDGYRIMPMLLETTDFRRYHISTLNGKFVRNKGMAMFPRKVGGDYLMVSRHDGEKLYLLRSDNPHFWNVSQPLQEPREPWELVQIGNCGSPVETEAGWILLTHGVGPVREYCVGAMLLDRDDPGKVLGRLRQPLLVPTADEREGYVPNVVYSCGPMIHRDTLIIPYAMSDVATKIATVPVAALVDKLRSDGP